MRLRNKETGEIVNFLSLDLVDDDEIEFTYVQASGHENAWSYRSLEKFKDEWEDYMPKEPLIKDEKIRKAVRAWAEANSYGKDEVYEFEDFSTGWKSWSLEHKVNGDDNEIHFNGGIDFDKVEHQGYYTIDELCGEEEE